MINYSNITFSKIAEYTYSHFNLIKDVYLKHNSINDTYEGQERLLKFISVDEANDRLNTESIFYEVLNHNKDLLGIIELEKNHIVLLYIKDSFQKKGIGKKSIEALKNLHPNYPAFTVFATPYSIHFYEKNRFKKTNDNIQEIQGLRYYSMKIDLKSATE